MATIPIRVATSNPGLSDLPVAATAHAAPRSTRAALGVALLRTARPKQWTKNLLVFAAPAAAGVLTDPEQLGRSGAAFAAFCIAASGTYFINDARDRESDRLHPKKRHRPVAAGLLSPRTAWIVGIMLAISGVAVASAINQELTLIVVGYLGLTIAYSLRLKHEPVVDLAAVAAGFVLRAVAGGSATGVPISDWFLIVVAGASFLIVTGKRLAEQLELGEHAKSHRSTLGAYSLHFLRHMTALASSTAIIAYCLWAFDEAGIHGSVAYRVSVIPFVLAILRYAHLVDQGHGGAPEDVLLSDRVMLAFGAAWALAFAWGVYG